MQQLQQVCGQGLVHRVHIVGDDADNVAGLVIVEEFDRQGSEIFKHIVAHLSGNPPGQVDHHNVQPVGQYPGGKIENHHQPGAAKDCGEVYLPGGNIDRVNGLTGQLRAIQPQQAGTDGKHNRQHQQESVPAQVLPKPSQHRTGADLPPEGPPVA